MKPILVLLVKRNALVTLVFVLLLTGLQNISLGHFTPPWLVLPFALFLGFLWANRPLFKSRRYISAVLLSLVLVPLLGFPASIGSRLLGRTVEEKAYKVRGYNMVKGCNGGAANGASGEVHTIEQQLEILSDESPANTNMIAQLHMVLPLAKEKARILSADCGNRGHRENYPWKPNWAAIRPVIKAAEEEAFK